MMDTLKSWATRAGAAVPALWQGIRVAIAERCAGLVPSFSWWSVIYVAISAAALAFLWTRHKAELRSRLDGVYGVVPAKLRARARRVPLPGLLLAGFVARPGLVCDVLAFARPARHVSAIT